MWRRAIQLRLAFCQAPTHQAVATLPLPLATPEPIIRSRIAAPILIPATVNRPIHTRSHLHPLTLTQHRLPSTGSHWRWRSMHSGSERERDRTTQTSTQRQSNACDANTSGTRSNSSNSNSSGSRIPLKRSLHSSADSITAASAQTSKRVKKQGEEKEASNPTSADMAAIGHMSDSLVGDATSVTVTASTSSASPDLRPELAHAPIAQSDPTLPLTALERRIFDHVLGACNMFKLETQVRVAGGWVRDKLLGLSSMDIDFALDRLSGEEFASYLSRYLTSIGERASGIGVIKLNPDQSKHLATATMKVCDVSIDINNFRQEVYAANSRIPEVKLATAAEDAQRRDFTVNALFYNIHTGKVEDYVGGLDDLRRGLLRTPRNPHITFSDDPLRILRAARFAARFGLNVSADIRSAARVAAVQRDLAQKVSRERMGMEIQKMLQRYDTAIQAFTLMCEWGIRHIVFAVPHEKVQKAQTSEIGEMELQTLDGNDEGDNGALTSQCLRAMQLAHETIQSAPTSRYSTDSASMLLLSAFLNPYYGYRVELKKNKSNTLIWHLVREALKLPQRDATLASDLLTHAHQLIRASYLHEYTRNLTVDGATGMAAASSSSLSPSSPPVPSYTPLECLQLVCSRIMRQSASFTPVALDLVSILLHLTPNAAHQLRPGSVSVFDKSLQLPSHFTHNPAIQPTARFNAFRRWIEEESKLLDLPVWEMKPLASGTEVCKVLGVETKGAHVGVLINRMMEWQVLHLDDLIPLHSASSAPSASASTSPPSSAVPPPSASSASPPSPFPSPPASASAPHTLEQIKSACFQWLKAQTQSSQ